MKYEMKKRCLDRGMLVTDRTMKEVARRLSKTARKQLDSDYRVAVDIDGYEFTLWSDGVLLNVNGSVCTRCEYQLFDELVYRTKGAIKAYVNMWSLLHEVNALQ